MSKNFIMNYNDILNLRYGLYNLRKLINDGRKFSDLSFTIENLIKEFERRVDILMIEERILTEFKKKVKGVSDLDLFVSLDDDIYSNTCEVIENKEYGRVWTIELNENLTIKSILELE